MSIESTAIIISGYKIPREMWRKGFEFCEEHWQDKTYKIPEYWEDMFIDMDCISGKGETFFGSIIYTVGETEETKEIDSIITHADTILHILDSFEIIFMPMFAAKKEPFPKFSKYLGLRWF